jgi:hypothetical protein
LHRNQNIVPLRRSFNQKPETELNIKVLKMKPISILVIAAFGLLGGVSAHALAAEESAMAEKRSPGIIAADAALAACKRKAKGRGS